MAEGKLTFVEKEDVETQVFDWGRLWCLTVVFPQGACHLEILGADNMQDVVVQLFETRVIHLQCGTWLAGSR